ncbi:MAG: hypothetical protein EOO40_04935, partial [Deltaproteobacteria bacterium]
TLESGERFDCRFLITALGPLSASTMPRLPGIDDFQGQSFHTSKWPHEPVDFSGKRVAIIGTGATGVQVIQTIAPLVGSLTVFQRTPNWATPLHNAAITEAEQDRIKSGYPAMFELLRQTPGCYIHQADPRGTFEVSAEEREAFWEELYAKPGFAIWMANFRDMLTDPKANALFSEFVAKKIRQRVKDPKVAEMLIPKCHGFGTRRVPQETRYYEAFNLPHVSLVDIKATPIERITATGIKTSDAERDFDMIIYATGFDAVTGSFDRVSFTGTDGLTLKDKWQEGTQTYLGLMSHGFPNMLTLVGPHNASTRCNIPRCIEQNVEWVAELMRYQLESTRRPQVPLSEELDYLRSYAQLQEMRLGPRCPVQVELPTEAEATGRTIAPLLLLALVENAFTYGTRRASGSFVHLRLALAGPRLTLTLRNALPPPAQAQGGTGTGLPNTRQRLALLYPGRHALHAAATAAEFHTDLAIDL